VELVAYGVILALVVILVWPGSAAGQALLSVAGSVSSTVRGA
jgi:hypothetical protein